MTFSFKYDDKKYSETELEKISTRERRLGSVKEITDIYRLDVLKITRIAKYFPQGGEYAVTYYENDGKVSSKILSEIFDADDALNVCSKSPKPGYTAYGQSGYTTLYDWKGSGIGADDFAEEYTVMDDRALSFVAKTGRSSEINLPFFDVNLDEVGYVYAVGWTGRWEARFRKDEKNELVRAQIGIHALNFFLSPNEKIRTAAVLRYPYSNGRRKGYNDVKRIIKNYIVTDRIKQKPLPFWISFWGGSTSDFMLTRLEELKEKQLDFDCFWIDAGWYGDYKEYCPSEFHSAWGNQVGNWFPNTLVHPGELKDVAEKVHECGYAFLLWFEPERADVRSRFYHEKREWFLRRREDDYNALLDLSRSEPRSYIAKIIGDYIETLGIDIYRQDFNIDSIYYWDENSPDDRKGLLEIKYVMGLYEFWDSLLARFPNLIIDNCASGGKRIDLETIARSVPLWRSDYQCLFDRDAEALQSHNAGISVFVPFSGSGVGQIMNDKYRRRSCYSAAMGGNFIGYEFISANTLDWDVKSAIKEFKEVREYFSCDFYPVFGCSSDHHTWGGWQFDRPEQGDGILMAFRRDECVLDGATIALGGIAPDGVYEFYDADTLETQRIEGKILLEKGYRINIEKKRDSRLIKYKKIKGDKNR